MPSSDLGRPIAAAPRPIALRKPRLVSFNSVTTDTVARGGGAGKNCLVDGRSCKEFDFSACIMLNYTLILLNMKDDAEEYPAWLRMLSEEDLHFIRRFVLSSGSLKELAKQYGISYPTVRLRLDCLIEKIHLADDPANKDPFRLLVRTLVVEGKVSSTVAKEIIGKHEETTDSRRKQR
jgi:hypothetical protein